MRRTTILLGLAVLSLAGGASQSQTQAQDKKPCPPIVTKSQDQLQVAARKALSGAYGVLPAWKRQAYELVIAKGLTVDGLTRRTNYCRHSAGRRCADGSPVRSGICAAPKSIPMHSIVWLASDGLVKVCDRGGAVRVGGGYTDRYENMRLDLWRSRCGRSCLTGTKRRVPWALIR